MSSFHLQIVTPDGLFYDGQAESLNLRAAQGGLTILPRHTNFVTTVGMGPAKVVLEGKSRIAAASVQSPRLPAPRKSWQTPLFPKRSIGLPSPQSAARRSV